MRRLRPLIPLGFVSGALAVVTVHQGALWLLHAVGWAPWPAYQLTPTRPFGVPQVLSAAFWGGVWGIVIVRIAIGQQTRTRALLVAAGAGAVLTTVVGALLLLVHLGSGTRTDASVQPLAALTVSLTVNGLWGAATFALGERLSGWFGLTVLDAAIPRGNV